MNKEVSKKIKYLLKMIEYCNNIPEEKQKWVNTLLSFLDGVISANSDVL